MKTNRYTMSFFIILNNTAIIQPTINNIIVYPISPIPKILVNPIIFNASLMSTIVATDNYPLNKENGNLYLLPMLKLSVMLYTTRDVTSATAIINGEIVVGTKTAAPLNNIQATNQRNTFLYIASTSYFAKYPFIIHIIKAKNISPHIPNA